MTLSTETLPLRIVEAACDAVLLADAPGNLLWVSPGVQKLAGYAPEELLERSGWVYVHPDDVERLQAFMTDVLAAPGTYGPIDFRIRTADGSVAWLEERICNALEDPELGCNVVYLTEVTERHRRELEQLAAEAAPSSPARERDGVTGLPPRSTLYPAIEAAAASGSQAVGLLLLDLDRFSEVNAAFGDSGGNQVLRALGRRLAEAVSDVGLVVRAGGDEFGVVVPQAGTRLALAALATKLAQVVAEPVSMGAARISVSASVGGALAAPAAGPDDLMRSAAEALEAAKDHGGPSQVLIQPADVHATSPSDVAIDEDLRRAVIRGTVGVSFDPLVRLGDDAVDGARAHLAWPDPAYEALTAAAKMRVAERTGLVDRIAERLLDAAHGVAGGWPGADDHSLVVPVMASTLMQRSFVNHVERLHAHDSRVDLLLHIVMGRDRGGSSALVAAMEALRLLGTRFVYDDLGLLGVLVTHGRPLNGDVLMLGSAVVQRAGHSAEESSTVTALVQLAHGKGMRVLANEVRHREHAELLGRLGVDLVTGQPWGLRETAADLGSRLAASARRRPRESRASSPLPSETVSKLVELHARGMSPATIAAALNQQGVPAPEGRRWHPASVDRAIAALQQPRADIS